MDGHHRVKQKVWWKCSQGHEWETMVVCRTVDSTGCPYCAGKKVWPGFKDLATLRPDIAADWNTEKNGTLTPQMVVPGSGESIRIKVFYDDPVCLNKVLVIRPRPKRRPEGELDASGYPIREGDPVVYMAPLVSNRCKGFEFGTVKKAAGNTWEVNGTRRSSDRMVVVNW